MFAEIAEALTDPRGAEFWVAVSFVIFIVAVWKVGGFRQLTAALDKRANTIQAELDEAKALREEAQKLLADYQAKKREAEAEAEGIVAAAKAEAERLKAESIAKAQDFVTRRHKIAEQKIALAETQAIADVRAAAADAAVKAAGTILSDQARGGAAARLMQTAIGEVTAKLN